MRSWLKTTLRLGNCSADSVLETLKMIDYLERLKFADPLSSFFEQSSPELRLQALKSLTCRQRMCEQRARVNTPLLPLFLYTTSMSREPCLVGSSRPDIAITKDPYLFNNISEQAALLYDVQQRQMVAYKDRLGVACQFSVLYLQQRGRMLNVKENTRNHYERQEPNLCKKDSSVFNGAAIYLDSEERLVRECWSCCGNSDIQSVDVVELPDGLQPSKLEEWIKMRLALLHTNSGRTLFLFVHRQKVVHHVLSKHVKHRSVHFYHCRYRPVVETYAQLRGLRTSILGLCHSLQNVQAGVATGVAALALLPDVREEDKTLLSHIQRELERKGHPLCAMLSAYASELADPVGYANFHKYQQNNKLKRKLESQERQEREIRRAEKQLRRTPAGELKFEDATISTTMRVHCPRKRAHAGRPRREERRQDLENYEQMQREKQLASSSSAAAAAKDVISIRCEGAFKL